jgi:hypothetical protein
MDQDDQPPAATGMPLEAIHLLLTYRCTYECEHCFVWGSPEQQGTMTLAQVREVTDQAAATPGVEMLYFEGGEPTLYYPVMVAGARYARELGLDVGVVTNCHWAETVDDALVWLQPFADMGCADFSLSSYAYFTEDLESEDHLRNAVVAAQRLGLPMDVLEVGAPAALADLGIACGEPGEIMYKGRAAVALAQGERLTRPPDTLTTCPYEDFAAPERGHVGCDGNLQLCQGISAGNLWERPLSEIAATYDPGRTQRADNAGRTGSAGSAGPGALPVIDAILRGGPFGLARATGLEPLLPLYADECHLCYELRARLRESGRYRASLAPDQAYGVVGADEDA